MSRRGLAALFLAIGIAIVVPSIALAATSGLVPCGVGGGDLATDCQACSVVTLIQNLITFLIEISVPIAMAMFAWAGVLYFTSGTGGSENISKAKNIFRSSLMGFVLALASWLIVNTLLNTVVSNAYFQNSGDWFHITCTTRDPGSKSIGDVITQHLGGAPTVVATADPYTTLKPSCTSGELKDTTYGEKCLDSKGNVVGTPTIAHTVYSQGVGNCSPSSLQGAWGSNAGTMSCIAQQESACGGNPYSGVDLTSNKQPISVGLYQINLSANKVQCGSQTLNCPGAFSGSYNSKKSSVSIVDQNLYNQCVSAALDNRCNTQTAVSIYDTQGIKAWGTAGKCGF